MLEATVVIVNPKGIHIRPSSLIAECARKSSSEVRLKKGSQNVNAKNVLEVMQLVAMPGDNVTISISDDAAEDLMRELKGIFAIVYD